MNYASDSPARVRQRDPWRALRYALRVPVLLLHLLLCLPLTVLLINPITRRIGRGRDRLDFRVIRLWSTGLLRIFGFRIRQYGQPLPGGVLFVANHVAWLDITLMHSRHVVGFVAKAEISRWPLIGWLASRGGTIYHHRGNNESLHGVMHQMVTRLQSGLPVGVFPEGRTTDGLKVHTFHARIFQPALAAGAVVQPVALRYGERGNAQALVAFQPGESFLQNFLRVLGDPPRVAEVHFLSPIEPSDEGRRRIAETARAQIAEAMDS
jgi:1-acyl-sn-glycerol-3-phosphate acyltransferase